ncbi:MAG: hypothetical protein ACI9XC_000923 [Gammaproteobacteria bacterium]|jgi:hypothetical protein
MFIKNKTKLFFWVTLLSIVLSVPGMAQDNFSPYVDTNGNISFPEGFRTSMVHLGSWYVPDGGASGFHDVYTEKETVEAFQETSEFPDGATLVKELRAASMGDYSTGQGVNYANNELKQWFVMIKDTKGRFVNNSLWGDGWGWALFKPDDNETNIAKDYKNDCLSCHIPARAKDLIYTEAYPTLNAD